MVSVQVAINLAHAAAIVQSKSPGIFALPFFQSQGDSWFLADVSTYGYSGTLPVLRNPQNSASMTKVPEPYLKKATLFSSIGSGGIPYLTPKCVASPICAHIF